MPDTTAAEAAKQREREAIRAMMKDMGVPVTYQDITQRAGPRLASTLMEMVQEGAVVREESAGGRSATYRPSGRGGTSLSDALSALPRGDAPAMVLTEADLERIAAPPSAERLAAEERAREMNRMLATGEATLIDKSGAV